MTDSGPAAPAPLDLGRCGICAAKLPHATDAESLKRANILHDAYEARELGAVQAERPRAPSDKAIEAAIWAFAHSTEVMESNKGRSGAIVWVPHNIVDAVRAAYVVDFPALQGAPNEETNSK
jgi:hypothetical protein